MLKTKLIVVGYGGHGKDSACGYLSSKYGFKFVSSSMFVGEKAVYPELQRRRAAGDLTIPAYQTFAECFEDRHNHRALWFQIISDYNSEDPARLGRELFAAGNNIYCGLRSKRELDALSEAEDDIFVVWIDASFRLPPEPSSSMTITHADADVIINNNSTIDVMYHDLDMLMAELAYAELAA